MSVRGVLLGAFSVCVLYLIYLKFVFPDMTSVRFLIEFWVLHLLMVVFGSLYLYKLWRLENDSKR